MKNIEESKNINNKKSGQTLDIKSKCHKKTVQMP